MLAGSEYMPTSQLAGFSVMWAATTHDPVDSRERGHKGGAPEMATKKGPAEETLADKAKRYGVDPESLLTPVTVIIDKIIHMKRETAYNQIRRGTFPFTSASLYGNRYYCSTSEVLEFIARHNGHKQ